MYSWPSRLDRLHKPQVLERCSCDAGFWDPGHKLWLACTETNLPSLTNPLTNLIIILLWKRNSFHIGALISWSTKYLHPQWDIGQPRLGKVPPWNKRRLLGTPPWCRNSHIRHMNHLPPETLRGSSHNPILLLWFITWNLKCPRITGTSRPMDLKDPRSQWHMARSFAGPDLGDVEYSSPYPIILMMSS